MPTSAFLLGSSAKFWAEATRSTHGVRPQRSTSFQKWRIKLKPTGHFDAPLQIEEGDALLSTNMKACLPLQSKCFASSWQLNQVATSSNTKIALTPAGRLLVNPGGTTLEKIHNCPHLGRIQTPSPSSEASEKTTKSATGEGLTKYLTRGSDRYL